MTELVSIIVTAYNSAETIYKCVKSACTQTYGNIEVIIVDDGSTDRTREICDELKKKYAMIQYVWQQNQGVAAARNRGLLEMKGSYFSFLDSDDWMEPTMVERMVQSIASPQTDIVICNAFINEYSNKQIQHENYFCGVQPQILSTGEEKKQLALPCISNLPKHGENCAYMHCGVSWCKLYRSSLIKNDSLYFHDDLRIGEDCIFFLYALEYADEIQYIPDMLYHYRINPHSLSHAYHENLDKMYGKLRDCLGKYVKLFHQGEQEFIVQYHWFIVESLNILLNNYQKSSCRSIGDMNRILCAYLAECHDLDTECYEINKIEGYGRIFKIIVRDMKRRNFTYAMIYKRFSTGYGACRKLLKGFLKG